MTRLCAFWGAVALVVASLLAPPRSSALAAAPSGREAVTPSPHLRVLRADGPYLHTDGGTIRDALGRPVRLSGVNWSGLETCNFAPNGLDRRSWWDILDQVRALGFNTIRLPYSDQVLDPQSWPQGINYALNPDLQGLSALQLMDRIVAGAGERGLRIILDRHRPDCTGQWPLWYSPQFPERRWIANLAAIARRYRREPAVIGIDLLNEPHDPATWGDGNRATDWRLAAERGGNGVLRINPHLLIFVEGIGPYRGKASWWGGNLLYAGVAPVVLAVPHRLVYEPHDYGPGLAPQPWFAKPDFPRNLTRMWDHHWGYLQEQDIAPVVLGEFGGGRLAPPFAGLASRPDRPATRDPAQADPIWLRALLSYLSAHPAMGFMYWGLMPDSADVGGLLNADWQTANITKEVALASLQGAAIPLPGAAPAPAPLRVLASDQAVGANQQILTIRVVNDSPRPLDLGQVELRYWCGQSVGRVASTRQQRIAEVDDASTGPGTVTPKAGIDRGYEYVALRFAALRSASSSLAPYGGVVEITLRLHRVDWAPYSPSGDWSYRRGPLLTLAPHVTLTLDGHLVWGVAPTGKDRS
jgi:endoglucanase